MTQDFRFLPTRRVLCLGAMLALPACSGHDSTQAAEFERNADSQPWTDIAVSTNLPYGGAERQRLDVYAPRGGEAPRPVVIFIHGGAWRHGSKDQFGWVGAAFARRGYVAVIPNYRLGPEGRWPTFVQDAAAAVRWARDHIATYGGDPQALVVSGHSAGAHSAINLAVDPRWLGEVGLEPQRDLKAAVGLSGVYILEPHGSELELFGPETGYTEANTRVGAPSPPMLFLIGEQDPSSNSAETNDLVATIRAHGGSVETIYYPVGHGGTVEAIAAPNPAAPVMDDIVRFLSAHGAAPH